MRAILDRLAGARGVRSAAVFDADGTFVDASGRPDATAALARCHARIRATFGDRTSIVARTSYATVARFEEGTLIVRCAPHAILIVLGEPDVDLSLQSTGFHIAVALKAISDRRASRRPGRISGVMAAPGHEDVPASERLRAPAVPKL